MYQHFCTKKILTGNYLPLLGSPEMSSIGELVLGFTFPLEISLTREILSFGFDL